MSTISSFKSIENKHDLWEFHEKICEFLVKSLTNKHQKSYENANIFHIKKIEDKDAKVKNYHKVRE